MDKITLKDIAQRMGVTTTTVHRALQGKEGVSEERRQEIQNTAAKMGYRSNYMAATLKRKMIRIAIALPEPIHDNKYYYGNMWLGIRRFLNEVTEFNIEPLDYTYQFTYGANGKALKDIYEKHIDNLDGLLTMGVDQGQTSYYIEKFTDRNIPIVFVGSDMYKDLRFCCVQSFDEMAGSLAAELLTVFNEDKRPKKAILTGHFGQLGMKDQLYNAMGFENYLKANAPYIAPLQIRGENPETTCYEIEQALKHDSSIFAIYSCSARYTIYLSEVIKKLGATSKIKFIGNDCFDESIELLKQGALTAIIDKKIAHQSYLAIKILFDYIVKTDYPRSSIIQVRPEVVLKSNADKDFITGSLRNLQPSRDPLEADQSIIYGR